jgi:hypothetical protein
VLAAAAPAGGLCPTRPCWKVRTHGFDYGNRTRTPDGLASLGRRGGEGPNQVTGNGPLLSPPNLATLTGPLDVQLQHSGGPCFGARYAPPFKKQRAKRLFDRAG